MAGEGVATGLARRGFAAVLLLAVAGCDDWTDAATRIAFDIEAGADRLGTSAGARHTIEHATPSRAGECTGPYKVQLDKVGALIVWCFDGAGRTVSSHSTSYHSRYIDVPRTWLVEKAAGESLWIELERRGGRAVVVRVR